MVDLPNFEIFLVTMIVASVRTIIEASPTILGGVAVAAWLRTQGTPDYVKTIFTGDGMQGWIRTMLVGMTMPVCSIGVLPVIRELRLLGLPTSKLIVLAIAAPLLNPLSLLFGLTVLSFLQYVMMIVATAILVIVAGEVSDHFAVGNLVEAVDRPKGLTGGTRMRNLLVAASRLVTGRTMVDVLATIVISTVALSSIRYGAIHDLCESSNKSGPAIASLLAIPQYISPSRAIVQFGGIRDANYSIATGMGIYLLGASIGGATIVTFLQLYGWRRVLALAIALSLTVGFISYSLSYTLPAPLGATAETAALDNLARPAYSSFGSIDRAFKESLVFVDLFMIASCVATAVLILVGLYVRLMKIGFRDDDPELAEQENQRRMAKALPASQIGAAAICVMGIFFCVSAYMFFPGPTEMLDVMERTQIDATVEVRSGNAAAAIDRISVLDSTAASIPIGATIRGSFPTKVQQDLTRRLRAELHNMRGLLTEGDLASAAEKLPIVKQQITETKAAFLGDRK